MANKKIHITWLVNDISLVGGIERVVCNLSNYFNQNNYDVKIVSLNSSEGEPHFNLNKSITIKHLGYPTNENLNRKNLKETIANFLRNEESDILITCHPWIAVPVLQQKRLYKGKIICTEHATWESYSKARRLLNTFYYRRADQLILLTNHTKKIYSKCGLKNLSVIPNIITDYPNPSASLGKKELIAAGRLTVIKGYDRLIEAISLIKDNFAPWHLTIYGDGEEHDHLIDLIHQNHLEELVSIEHFTNSLQKKLHDSSGFIVSSHSEAFPMVALESLKEGLPVISFDIPSLREIDHRTKTIIFAKQDDVNDLASKISYFIHSDDRKKRGRSSLELSQNYSLDKIGPKWLNLFESLFHGH